MKIAIFLGAGASAAEHCPIQSQLFVEYFKSLTQKDYKSEMNIELHKFFKDMFNIDIINDGIDKISFPTFEEVLGLIDLAEQRRESFKNFGLENLHKKSDSIRILRQYLINGGAANTMLKLGIGIQVTTKRFMLLPKEVVMRRFIWLKGSRKGELLDRNEIEAIGMFLPGGALYGKEDNYIWD